MNNILTFLLFGLVALTVAEQKYWEKIMKQADQNAQNVQGNECEGKNIATLCEELAQFTPQLCSNNLAMLTCTEQCRVGRPRPAMKCTEQCGGGRPGPGMKLIKIMKTSGS